MGPLGPVSGPSGTLWDPPSGEVGLPLRGLEGGPANAPPGTPGRPCQCPPGAPGTRVSGWDAPPWGLWEGVSGTPVTQWGPPGPPMEGSLWQGASPPWGPGPRAAGGGVHRRRYLIILQFGTPPGPRDGPQAAPRSLFWGPPRPPGPPGGYMGILLWGPP